MLESPPTSPAFHVPDPEPAMDTLRQLQEEEHRLVMTPMIDVTFLLLVFFMCTIKFKTLEGKLAAYLPKTNGPDSAPAEVAEDIDLCIDLLEPGRRVLAADPGTIWTEGSGEFDLVGHEVAYRLGRDTYAGTATGRAALVRRLTELRRAAPDRKVVVHPGEVVHGDVVTVLDACLAAGVEAISFGASKR